MPHPALVLLACLCLAPGIAAETVLLDLADPAAGTRVAANDSGGSAGDAGISFIGQGPARAMPVACRASAGFPGVVITPPGGAWDLSGSAWIEARVANPGPADLALWIRVDNAGSWRDAPWNTEQVTVPAGATVPVRVRFGRSMGKPGFALDPKAVTRVLLFLLKPAAPGTFVVHALVAGGKAGEAP